MKKKIILTQKAPKPSLPISQAVVAGDFVFVSGTVGADPATGKLVEGGFAAQTERVFQNISIILEAAGATMDDVLKVNVYLKNRADFKQFNSIYLKFFDENQPARTTVQSTMVYNSILIEADCIAHRPRRNKN